MQPNRKRSITTIGVAAIISVLAIGLVRPALKRRAESIDCRQRMRSIGFAALIWADDHGGRLPSNFISMSNELNNPIVLLCPSDGSNFAAVDFPSLKSENTSYEIVKPGLFEQDSNAAFLRCKVHGFVLYVGDLKSGKLPK